MRDGQNLEWCVNLSRATKKMMRSSKEEIKKMITEYPIFRKITDQLFARTDYSAAEYSIAKRFVKKYY